MNWLRALIKRLVGRDRYHSQASEVTARSLRVELLNKQAQVIRRGR